MDHSLPDGRLDGLDDPERGLTGAEVEERRQRFGRNDILIASSAGWRELLRDTLKDPMLWFLLGTGLLYAVLGETREALVLLAALAPFLGMDAYLHRRTQASTAGLGKQLAAEATVIRDGRRAVVPAAELVPGDLVELAAGDSAPADAILCAGDAVQVDESALTGEAYPVRKRPRAARVRPDPDTAEDESWVMAGSRLLTGNGRLRIVRTGAETQYGAIVRSALQGRHERTPLQAAIGRLVGVLVGAALLLCTVLALIRWQQGHGLLDALLSAVTLAVAALPEEFPIVFTFFLGVGVYRLARQRALVRRGVVVENIGRVTTICADKTGTLTEGRLELGHLVPAEGIEDAELLRIAAAASDADGSDPVDVAIFAAAPKTDLEPLARFPFTEDRKRETSIVGLASGAAVAVVKGAPETVLDMSSFEQAERDTWLRRIDELASGAHKMIAVARRELAIDASPHEEPQRGYRFVGLLAFEDPVRAGVIEAVEACRSSGIRVLMITGDHPRTAAAIGREIGLADGAPVVTEADAIEAAIQVNPGAILEVDVIARAVPSQKLAVVRALQGLGEIVAVTGDGVNDVPALQAADIGIAMGRRGTQSAREVAAIVLPDDNFSSIVRAIGEGQQLFSNLKLSFAYLLMIHLPLVLSAALVPLAGGPLLYLPIHIVWLELIIHPTALLVFQDLPGDRRLVCRRGPARVRFFDRAEWATIAAVGLLLTVLLLVTYDWSLGATADAEHARAMVLVALCIASGTMTAVLSRLRTRTAWAVVLGSIGVTAVLVQTPFLASRLHVLPLHLDDWLIATAGGCAVALLTALGPISRRSARE